MISGCVVGSAAAGAAQGREGCGKGRPTESCPDKTRGPIRASVMGLGDGRWRWHRGSRRLKTGPRGGGVESCWAHSAFRSKYSRCDRNADLVEMVCSRAWLSGSGKKL